MTIATSLIQSADKSTYGETYETKPSIYKVSFKKDSTTLGYKGNTSFGDERYSIINLPIDIAPKAKEEALFLAE